MGDESWTLGQASREVHAILNSVKDYAIFLLDPDGRIVSWNKGAAAIKQYRADEIVGHHIARFYTPDDLAAGKPARLLEAAVRDGRVEDEGWRVRKDGTLLWADVVITAVRNEAGALIGFVKVTRDLTERRNAEETLRRSEASLAATLHSIGDGVIATDGDGRVTRMNPVAEALTGWEEAQARGRAIDEVFRIINEDTRRPAVNPVARVLAEGIVVGLANHTALVARDGTERPIADSGAPIRDREGRSQGAVLVFRDVTEQRRAEEALRASEERLRLMVGSVHDYAIFMLTPDGRVASWNLGAQRIKGYSEDEILGAHFSRFYLPDDVAAGVPARELEIAAREGRLEEEAWRVRKDGSQFWASVVISAMRDAGGSLVGFTKVTRDMTDRRRAAEELARRAIRQTALAELGVFAVRTRELKAILERAIEIVGRTLGTEMTKVLELVSDGVRLRLCAGVGWREGIVGTAIIPAGPGTLGAFVLGSTQPIVVQDLPTETRFIESGLLAEHGAVSGLAAVIPIPEQDRPYGVFATFTRRRTTFPPEDVVFFQAVTSVIATAIARSRAEEHIRTAERAAQEEKEKAERAEEAVRDRDVFLSVAAHELRTPLTALQLKLQGLEQMVGRELKASTHAARAEARFKDALRQTERLGELVERLLDVSRMAAGKLKMKRERFKLEGLVRDVLEDFQEKADEANTELRVSVDGDTYGHWDRRRLEQVLLNLLSNAVKYGQGKPIDVNVVGSDTEVRLHVADRGIGIGNADLARIFEAFERAAPVENFAGLGLGLYITRRIVEAHGGKVEVLSAPNEGATFVVTLPKGRIT